MTPANTAAAFDSLLTKAIAKRGPLNGAGTSEAVRLFSAEADGLAGIFVDRYGSVAVLMLHEGVVARDADPARLAQAVMQLAGVESVYLKVFPRDRSRLGGEPPESVTCATPHLGRVAARALQIREHGWLLEIRPYDGWSTGLFLDQRENRKWVHDWVGQRAKRVGGTKARVLNTFAYTCAFSVAAAAAGAETTSVDVSARYLEWGKRNFGLNQLAFDETSGHRFARMDTFEFFAYAIRKQLRYDLIILDPPSFGSGNKRRGIRPWSAMEDYARLVREAASLLSPAGVILCSTNTTGLCGAGRLEREISKGLGRQPRWLKLPPPPLDFREERHRFAAVAFCP